MKNVVMISVSCFSERIRAKYEFQDVMQSIEFLLVHVAHKEKVFLQITKEVSNNLLAPCGNKRRVGLAQCRDWKGIDPSWHNCDSCLKTVATSKPNLSRNGEDAK